MQNDAITQMYSFGIFIVNGLIIGVLFDVFRISRKTFKTSNIITYIEDIVFWILTGLILLFSIFTFNNGEIRNYIFLGVITGFTFYMLFLSKFFIKINVKIINILKTITTRILKIIIYPIKITIRFLKNIIIIPTKFIYRKIIEKSVKKLLKMLKNIKFYKKTQKTTI